MTEGTSTAVITVNRVGTSSGTTVRYRVSGGTAEGSGNGKDYTLAAGTLTFNANETVKTFTVAITNDIVIEPDETVIIELYEPSIGLGIGLRGSATLTIHDNDAPTVKFGAATYRVVEGTPGAIVVTRDRRPRQRGHRGLSGDRAGQPRAVGSTTRSPTGP